MDEKQRAAEVKRINERNDYARLNYGHLPTKELDIEKYIYKTISDSKEIDYHQGECDGYRNLASHYITSDSSIDAFEILQKVEKLIDVYDLEESNTLNLYVAYLVYYMEYVGELTTATSYAKKGLELAEKLNDKNMYMRLKMNLGVINIRLGYLENAKELLESTLDYYTLKNDEFRIMYVYNNLAEVYFKLNLIDKAKSYYQKAIQLSKEKDDISIRIDASNGLSKIYAKEEHYTDAIEIINEVVEYLDISKNVKFKCEVNIQLANIYVQDGDYKKAYSILSTTESRINEIENQVVLISFYELYAKVASFLGEYKVAYCALENYQKYYIRINDVKADRTINEMMRKEYKKTISRLEAISKVGRELTTLSNVTDVLFEVKKILSGLMDINGIGIGELKGNVIEFNHFLEDGLKMDQKNTSLDNKNSFAVWAINNKKEVHINDVDKDYGLYIEKNAENMLLSNKSAKQHKRTRSVLYAPLIVKGETIGVFTIQSFKKNAFASEEVEIFRIIVTYVAIAFKNASQSMMLEELSSKDSITGMNNRRAFSEFYQSIEKGTIGFKINHVSMLMMDLDHFKKVNDNYSHVAGDKVLIEVAKIFMSKEEKSIISGRLGGEEFGFIILNKSKKFILNFAENIRKEIEELDVEYDNQVIKVTISIGVTIEKYSKTTELNHLYFNSDKALYSAKKNGRNRVDCLD